MGLKVDYFCGEGSVTLPKRLADADALLRADVIRDWICDLERLYRVAVEEFYEEMEDVRIEAGHGPFPKEDVEKAVDIHCGGTHGLR